MSVNIVEFFTVVADDLERGVTPGAAGSLFDELYGEQVSCDNREIGHVVNLLLVALATATGASLSETIREHVTRPILEHPDHLE